MDIEITMDDFMVATKGKQNNALCFQISNIPVFVLYFLCLFHNFHAGSISYKIFPMFLKIKG